MPPIDFGRHARDYAVFRPGFPDSFYERLESFIDFNGLRGLDFATGPGVVALQLARRGATVIGIDIAPSQIDAARERARQLGLEESATFEVCRGEAYEAPPGTFDFITAGQCWRWFEHETMLGRIMRMLKPGGWFIVAHFDYIVHRSDIARRTEDLILQHNPSWTLAGKSGLYPHYIDQVIDAGFDFREQFCYDVTREFSHESWRGRIRTCNGVGSGGMPPDGVKDFDKALSELLEREYPDQPLRIWHRVWTVVARKPGADS